MSEYVDVLLVNPGDRKQIYQDLGDEFCGVEPPVFAGLFATYLRRKGLSAAIVDAPALGISASEVARIVTEDFTPQLVVLVVYGFQPSASTHNMTAAGAIAQHIKEADSSVKIMMTGTHLAALPERTMREEAVDFVCDLEGPVTIFKTVEALKAVETDFSKIPSLWWWENGGIISPRTPETLVADLDSEMPGIAWDLLPMERYRAHNWHCFDHIDERSPYAAIHTSLGCPYKCSFCCINAPFGRPAYRMWDPKTVVAEIDFLVETYGVKNIKFVDEMFVLNKRHVLGICELLASRDYSVNIWAYARVDTVKDGLLDPMKEAGINWLCLGIESASEHVRDGADKHYGNEEITDVVQRIRNAGIYVIGNYMFGLPDDTHESMQATLDLALNLECEFTNFYSAMAYPGSPLYRMAVDKGLPLPSEWKDFSPHGYAMTPLANEHLNATDITEFRDHAFTTYFTHPPYLEMVEARFGHAVRAHIERMVAVPLPRKLIEERLSG